MSVPSTFPIPRTAAPVLISVVLMTLGGCAAVGPDYHGAPTILADSTAAQGFARATGIASAAPPPAAWWKALGDARLDRLVDLAVADSPDVRAVQARLRQARAGLAQQDAARLPTSSATVAALDLEEAPGTSAAQSLHGYTAGLDASWELDLFGGTRRAIEAAGDEAEAVQADLADAQVSLAAEVVQAYVALRDSQTRLALQHRIVAIDQQRLAFERQRVDRGVDSALDFEKLVGEADASAADLSDLEGQVAVSLDELACLTGREPAALDAELAAPAPLPPLPAQVTVGDPAGVLARRPDIRAAERRLASQQAQIGEKAAGYFPKVSLFGDLGFSATEPDHLVRRSSLTLLGVPYLSWNVLDFGRTAASVRQAEAGRDEAAEHYRSVVLAALRDANTALTRFGTQREQLRRLQLLEASAGRSEALSTQRRAQGADSQLDLLAAQRGAASASARTVAAQATLVKDFAALQKSLGLGWQAVSPG